MASRSPEQEEVYTTISICTCSCSDINSHLSVGMCGGLVFFTNNLSSTSGKMGKWDGEKWVFRPIFVPFYSFSSTTSRHNSPQPTFRVLCPLFPHAPPPPFPPIFPHLPPISPIFHQTRILESIGGKWRKMGGNGGEELVSSVTVRADACTWGPARQRGMKGWGLQHSNGWQSAGPGPSDDFGRDQPGVTGLRGWGRRLVSAPKKGKWDWTPSGHRSATFDGEAPPPPPPMPLIRLCSEILPRDSAKAVFVLRRQSAGSRAVQRWCPPPPPRRAPQRRRMGMAL